MSKRATDDHSEQKAKKVKAAPVSPVSQDDHTDGDVIDKARYFATAGLETKGSETLPSWEGTEAPTTDEEIVKLVSDNGLRHGDVISFNNMRHLNTVIVCIHPESGKVQLVKNPDESRSGYLTIPESVLKHVDNFHKKYEDIIKHAQSVNFHPSCSDKFLASYLGAVPEEGWEFDVSYVLGELESFSVKPRKENAKYETFNIEDTTWEDVAEFFKAKSGSQAEIKVKVKLEGDELERYKNTHSESGKVPELPKGWRCEKGASSGGTTKMHWVWKISGPSATESEARENVKAFLKDFTHEYE